MNKNMEELLKYNVSIYHYFSYLKYLRKKISEENLQNIYTLPS